MYFKNRVHLVVLLLVLSLLLFLNAQAEFSWEILLEEDFEDLSANGWSPQNSANWKISKDNGDYAYHQWNTNITKSSDYVNEWAVYDRTKFDNFSFCAKARTAEDLGANPYADFGLIFHYQDKNNFYYVSFNAQKNETVLILKQAGVEKILARASTPIITNTADITIAVTSFEGEIYVSAKDLTIFRFFDLTFTQGYIGIGTCDDAVYFDDIVVCEKEEKDCEFFADFNNMSLNGWTALDRDNWSLSKKDGSIVLFLTSTNHTPPDDDQLGEIITLNNIDAEQFTFECDLKSIEWENPTADLGLVFCYFDKDNYYGVTFSRSANHSRFVRVKNGSTKILDEYPNALLTDLEWHHVKVHVPGANYYEIYFDDVLVLEQWNGDLTSGKIGVGSQNDMGYFDNICVNGQNIFHETITLTYPNGGEVFAAGETVTISWLSEGVSNNVMLEYSTDGGATWTTIISSTLNDNQFDWIVPDVTSNDCLLRIKDIDGSPADICDAPFSIIGGEPCSITVTNPAGGETFYTGSACAINWTSTGTLDHVNIEYQCDGAWTTIVNGTPNDGLYSWTIPDNICAQAKIKVSNADDPDCFDESNIFSIKKPSALAVMPACNVLWEAGSTHKISWTPAPFAANVKIEYSKDGGAGWSVIAANVPDKGCYEWTTPTINSTQCIVKVSDANNLNSYGESSLFSIGSGSTPYLLITDVFGEAGTVVTADIKLKGNTTPFDAFGLTLSYDSNHMNYLGTEKSGLTSSWIQVSGNENTAGVVTVGGFNTSALPTNSDGVLAKVTFEITCSNCDDCTQSHLGISNMSDDAAHMTGYCGTFTWGTPCVLGDVNMDEAITPGDALCAFNIYLNNQVPPADCNSECALLAADANCDATVTPGDALTIFEHYLNGQPIECPTSQLAKSILNAQVSFADVTAAPGSSFTLPIRLDNPNGLSAFGLEISYPGNLVEFCGLTRTALTQDWIALDASISANGTLLVGGYHAEKMSRRTSGSIAELHFTVKNEAAGSGSIDVVQASDDLMDAHIQSAQINTEAEVITSFSLEQNYPNPFNMTTDIRFAVPEESNVTIDIYNLTGKKVRTLINASYKMGRHHVVWDGRDEFGAIVTSGVYLYKLTAGATHLTKKMMILK